MAKTAFALWPVAKRASQQVQMAWRLPSMVEVSALAPGERLAG